MNSGVAAFLAASPILVILILMLGFRWSAAKAGGIGLVLTLVLAWWVFGFGSETLPALGAGKATLGSLAEAVFTAVTILWIIFPALCIHELQLRTGSVEKLREALGGLSQDPRIIALLVAWFFALFMEGAAGFGTSVALAAPFLVGAGFKKVEAVTVAMVGHAVGVSFGAVGTPILPQAATTGFSELELSASAGLYHSLLGWVMTFLLMVLVNRSMPPQSRTAGGIWCWTLLAAALFLVPYFFMSRYIGPELPTLTGSLLGGVMFVVVLTAASKRRPAVAGAAQVESHTAAVLLKAAAPYLALVILVLVSRLIPEVRQWLSGLMLSWRYNVFSGSMAVLYHPGSLLLASFLIGALVQRAGGTAVSAAMFAALRRLLPVTLALIAMLGLSRLMLHAGMIETLAQSAAAVAGPVWPLLAPFVGALGTFVTGSATASNILFTDFQQSTAQQLGLPALTLLGAQTFGAAVGNIICPHNIIAASATVHLAGGEGDVLRRTLGPMLLYTFLGGALAWFLVL